MMDWQKRIQNAAQKKGDKSGTDSTQFEYDNTRKMLFFYLLKWVEYIDAVHNAKDLHPLPSTLKKMLRLFSVLVHSINFLTLPSNSI